MEIITRKSSTTLAQISHARSLGDRCHHLGDSCHCQQEVQMMDAIARAKANISCDRFFKSRAMLTYTCDMCFFYNIVKQKNFTRFYLILDSHKQISSHIVIKINKDIH